MGRATVLGDVTKDSITIAHKWHPEKSPAQLRAWLAGRYGKKYLIPTAPQIARTLEERGFVPPAGRRPPPGMRSRVPHVTRPNEMWCARLGDPLPGGRAAPFSLVDAYTGHVLRLDAVESPWDLQIDNIFRSAYRQYGQPDCVRTPRAVPFVTDEPGQVSDLVIWLMRSGVRVDRRPRQPFHAIDVSDLGPTQTVGELQRLYDARRKALNEEPAAASYVRSSTPHYASLLRPEEHVWGREILADDEGRIPFKGRKLFIARAARSSVLTLAPYDWARELHEVHLGPIQFGLLDARHPKKGLLAAPFQGVLSLRPEDPPEEIDWEPLLARW
jgi:hypothetical protein